MSTMPQRAAHAASTWPELLQIMMPVDFTMSQVCTYLGPFGVSVQGSTGFGRKHDGPVALASAGKTSSTTSVAAQETIVRVCVRGARSSF